jgi:hypothetical protein
VSDDQSEDPAMTTATPENDARYAFGDALRYWEPLRVLYNLALVVASVAWVVLSWPHFRESLTWQHVAALSVLALLANACYCSAYIADLFVQRTADQDNVKRWRWTDLLPWNCA